MEKKTKKTKSTKTTKVAKSAKPTKSTKTKKGKKATKATKATNITKTTKKELTAEDRKKISGGNLGGKSQTSNYLEQPICPQCGSTDCKFRYPVYPKLLWKCRVCKTSFYTLFEG